MKRMTAFFLAVLMLLSLAACRKAAATRAEASAEVQQALQQLPEAVAKPESEVKSHASLKDLNKACGAEIVLPGARVVENELFETMTLDGMEIGQYVFTADGLSCALRFSPDIYRDVSGVTGDSGDSIFDGVKGDIAFADGCTLGRWNTTAGQYVLIAATGDISEFTALFEELKAAIPG